MRQPSIGVSIPNHWGIGDVRDVVNVAVEAEELGFASVWVTEHMLNVGFVRDLIGPGPCYHPLALLSYVAARTSTIALGTSVVVLPFHYPVDLAKYAATLDQLSGGRLILGFGSGGMAQEFEALGLPFRERGSVTDEA